MFRLLVADDHHMFREGVTRLLADDPQLVVEAQAATCAEALEAVRQRPIDLALVDLNMPGRGGLDLIAHLKAVNDRLRILVVTMHGEDAHVTHALRAGADGYLTKEHAADELLRAVRRVARGERYVCASVAERLALGIVAGDNVEQPHALLTEREYKVFELLVAGKRGHEIADELSLSQKTVSTHKAHVLRKMKASNRTELVLYAIKHRLVAV